MVAVMTAAPLDMHHHGSALGAIGLVLSAHTLGMFAVAPVSGRLADRHGGAPVMLAGLCLAAGACAFAAAAATTGDAPHGVIYFGLGVAWNLAFVGGSTALSRGADAEHRLALEGAVDAVVWSVAAVAGAGSTVLLGAGGFPLLGGVAAVIALVAAAAVAWSRPVTPRRSASSPAASRPGY
jgi:MFS family permease